MTRATLKQIILKKKKDQVPFFPFSNTEWENNLLKLNQRFKNVISTAPDYEPFLLTQNGILGYNFLNHT